VDCKKHIVSQAAIVKDPSTSLRISLDARTPPDQLKMYHFALESAGEIG
jgi:hypothetical protein